MKSSVCFCNECIAEMYTQSEAYTCVYLFL